MTSACCAGGPRQLTFDDFGKDSHIFRDPMGEVTGITTRSKKKTRTKHDPREPCEYWTDGARCRECEGANLCKTHKPYEGCHVEVNKEITNPPKKPRKEFGADKNCSNCLANNGGIRLKTCPSFEDVMNGKVTIEDLEKSVREDGCVGWNSDPPKKTPKIGVDLQYCETLCANCENHLASFSETCPRYNDLADQGGKYSENELMEEIQRDGCPHKIPKCQPAKKAPKKKSSNERES